MTGATTITRSFITDEAGAIIKMTVATTPTAGPDDGTYLVTWNGHGDAIGIAEIGATGALTPAARMTYSTWGTPTVTQVNGYGSLGFRYLYVGRFDVQWDNFASAGLHYMHARHYSPELGRFLQPDPSALEANLYAYTENGPITKIDPTGAIAWCAIPLIGWAACAFGVRVALWAATTAGGAVANFIGSVLVRSTQAAPIVAGKGPLVLNVSRDWLGRVRGVSGVITPATLRTGTAASHAARSWCCNSSSIYEAGHLIAKAFGGPGGLRSGNITAMLRDLNQGAYKNLEMYLLRVVEAGNRVTVHVQPIYSGTSAIPIRVAYWYRINNGAWQVRYFAN